MEGTKENPIVIESEGEDGEPNNEPMTDDIFPVTPYVQRAADGTPSISWAEQNRHMFDRRRNDRPREDEGTRVRRMLDFSEYEDGSDGDDSGSETESDEDWLPDARDVDPMHSELGDLVREKYGDRSYTHDLLEDFEETMDPDFFDQIVYEDPGCDRGYYLLWLFEKEEYGVMWLNARAMFNLLKMYASRTPLYE
jgi:hypothetical protein